MTIRTRFAPSPTGPLHLGHAYSALLAFDMALAEGGDFLLRIEDIDRSRARPEWESLIYEDLAWLGLNWPEPVMRQSGRLAVYHAQLQTLWADNLLFACTCSRRDVTEAASAPQEGAVPVTGPDGIVYPGTCRGRRANTEGHTVPADAALRLDMGRACARLGDTTFSFLETGAGPDGESGMMDFTAEELTTRIGDVVLARRDMGTSYHLSVVLDDAAQNVTRVIRGEDLFEATRIHVVLQRLLGLPTPIYHHHPLIRDDQGKRLAKRDDARAISLYRDEGATPTDLRAMVGLSP